MNFDEFQITDIALPLSNGDRLVFNDPFVYVPEGTTLPAGLTGVLGENLWMQSTDEIDPDTGLPIDTYAPLFSEWYLDGPGSQLVLYDPNSNYNAPEPAAVALLGLGLPRPGRPPAQKEKDPIMPFNSCAGRSGRGGGKSNRPPACRSAPGACRGRRSRT